MLQNFFLGSFSEYFRQLVWSQLSNKSLLGLYKVIFMRIGVMGVCFHEEGTEQESDFSEALWLELWLGHAKRALGETGESDLGQNLGRA